MIEQDGLFDILGVVDKAGQDEDFFFLKALIEPYSQIEFMIKQTEIISALTAEMMHQPQLQVLILFGSAATDRMRDDSDVDVAVLYKNALSAQKRMALQCGLEERLGRSVDVVDLFALNGVILKKILTQGTMVIKRDPSRYETLLQRMVYNQQDMMPYYHRALAERRSEFCYG